MHMVTMPYFTCRRFISRKIVAVSFALADAYAGMCENLVAAPTNDDIAS